MSEREFWFEGKIEDEVVEKSSGVKDAVPNELRVKGVWGRRVKIFIRRKMRMGWMF